MMRALVQKCMMMQISMGVTASHMRKSGGLWDQIMERVARILGCQHVSLTDSESSADKVLGLKLDGNPKH